MPTCRGTVNRRTPLRFFYRGSITTSTGSVALSTAIGGPGTQSAIKLNFPGVNEEIALVTLTNCDATDSIFIELGNSAANAQGWKKLAPGASVDMEIDAFTLNNAYCFSTANTPVLAITCFGCP